MHRNSETMYPAVVPPIEISNPVHNERELGRRLSCVEGIIKVHGLKYTHARLWSNTLEIGH
jgi:hypothetical protein